MNADTASLSIITHWESFYEGSEIYLFFLWKSNYWQNTGTLIYWKLLSIIQFYAHPFECTENVKQNINRFIFSGIIVGSKIIVSESIVFKKLLFLKLFFLKLLFLKIFFLKLLFLKPLLLELFFLKLVFLKLLFLELLFLKLLLDIRLWLNTHKKKYPDELETSSFL